MFEFIRNHLKLVMVLFFPLVILAFVFVGVDASMLTQRSPVVARVAGTDITQAQWDATHRQLADQARLNNPGLGSAVLDSPQQKYAVLERLVRDEVYRAALLDKRYVVSDAQLARALQAEPEIASLRKPDGSLDIDAYRNWVASRYGLTPESFEERIRYNLGLEQVIGAVQQASLATPAQAKPSLDALFQRREIQTAEFRAADYAGKVQTSDEQLQTFYQQNSALFQQPEQVDAQYLVLDLDSVIAGIDINENELRQYYESNKQSYSRSPEQRRARHILVSTTADMSASEREAARAKATGLLQQLRQNPERFAELAKANSEDPGSGAAGGDLGLIGRGEMVAAFDEAVFRLAQNAISDLVATEYGFHIIQVTEIKPADIPGFEEVRERIAQDVKNDQARSRFIEAADQLRNIAHEQPDNLEPAATALGLSIQTASGITRTATAETPAILNNAALLEELFSAKLLDDRYNSDAFDVGGNRIVVARVTQHHPARVLPLDEVRDSARTLLSGQESARLAREAGEKALNEWKSRPDAPTALQKPVVVSRMDTQGLDSSTIKRILQAPQNSLPALEGFDQAGSGYLVVRINRIADAAAAGQDEPPLADYAQALAQAETEAYYETLKRQYKAQIRVPRPN